MPIGNGLFSKEFIRAGSQIVHFNGTELPNREAVQRAKTQSNHGGYVLSNYTETYGIDCYDTASRLQCFASMANSPYKCHNVVRNSAPRANVRKSIATVNGKSIFGLIAAVDIQPFTEILVNYGAAYIFPSHYDEKH
jgi:SET domain-containing protein